VNKPHIQPHQYAQQRRSQRILLSVSLLVSGKQAGGAPFSERTHTLVVSAHGALIQLQERVVIGQKLRIKHLATNEEMNCTVVDVNPGNSSIPEVAVEFSEVCPRFWRVSFPPADWSSRSAEAKRMSSGAVPANAVVVKK